MHKRTYVLPLLACIILLGTTNSYGYTNGDVITEKWFKASDLPENKQWTFEFKNKVKKPLYVRIFQGTVDPILEQKPSGILIGPSKGSQEKDHSYFRVADINPGFDYELWMSYKPENNESIDTVEHAFIISSNKNRKQLFLTWEKNDLRAQSGVKGKTQSGIPLESNVKKTEIERRKR